MAGAEEGDRRPPSLAPVLVAILALGIGIRFAYAFRPLDDRMRTGWRQSDSIGIARNFFREEMDLFHPRVDWRGDTPGYAEMELPVLPWTAALLYRIVGYHECIQRLLSAALESAGLVLFAWLAVALLPPGGAVLATAAFAANPLLVYFASAMQPEPLMHLLILVAMALLLRWKETPRTSTLVAAAAAVAGATLAKAQAVFGVAVMVDLVVRRRGWKALARADVCLALAVSLVPPLLWYAWARHFWTVYGNSLGLSNEAHVIGFDLIVPPWFLGGNAAWDALATFTPPGVLLALAALFAQRDRGVGFALPWYLAVWGVYVVNARTALDPHGGFYYHSASVAPGCLLMGAGFAALRAGALPQGWLGTRQRALGSFLGAATVLVLIASTAVLIYLRDYRHNLGGMRRCALEFTRYVAPTDTIVTDGGRRLDNEGYPISHNASMFFAWMDRRGFVYPEEDLAVGLLDDIARRGGRFWIASHDELDDGLREVAEQRYRMVADCTGGYTLFDLGAAPRAPAAPPS